MLQYEVTLKGSYFTITKRFDNRDEAVKYISESARQLDLTELPELKHLSIEVSQ
jgi:hypothetical protein